MEEKSMNISPAFVFGLDKILDYLVENEDYIAQFGDTQIRYEGIIEDTLYGKRSAFTIIRKEK